MSSEFIVGKGKNLVELGKWNLLFILFLSLNKLVYSLNKFVKFAKINYPMKLVLISLLTFLASFTFAQLNISYVDFYSWTSEDNVQYTTMIVSEEFLETGSSKSIVRVKYAMDGLTKIAEFDAIISYETQYESFDVMIMGDETASFIKGSGSYTPDNFILSFDFEGNFLDGYQADHNELDKGDEVYLAEMSPIMVEDANNMRELMKEFYTSSDSLYRDLMTYAAQFD